MMMLAIEIKEGSPVECFPGLQNLVTERSPSQPDSYIK